MVETTDEYRNRINQLKTSIENEPYIKEMRSDIAEGISKTGNRQADIEVRQDKLEDDFVAVQQDASSASPSGAEVAVARGEYNTLDERLTEEEQKVTAQLADITDDGYLIADMIGLKKYNTEEEARLNVDNDNNAELLQGFLDSGHKIKLNSGYYAFEKELIWGYGNLIKGSNKTVSHMLFPNSRGIVFGKKGYFGNLQIKDLSITSKSHCIDFKNDSGLERANNVYQSEIEHLHLNSEEGHCVYAGDNRGTGGDQLIFEQVFSNIRVTAPMGSGFYGIGGLGIRFEYINDAFAIKNIFENCHGQFSNINTSFAQAEYFLFFGSDAPANYAVTLDFYNVNMEDVLKAGIRIESTRIVVKRLSMVRTTYSPPKAQTTPKTEPPFYFPEIEYLEYIDSGASSYPERYDTNLVKAPFYAYVTGASIKVVSDKEVSIYSGAYKKAVTWNKSQGFTDSAYSAKFGEERYEKREEIHAETLSGGRSRKIKEVLDGAYNFSSENIYDEFRYKITSSLTLPFLAPNNLTGSRMFTVSNHSQSTSDLTIQHGTLRVHGGRNLILKPGQSTSFILIGSSWQQVITSNDITFSASTSTRPSDPIRGQSVFDTSIAKPIWWNGNIWIDSQGATV